MDEIPTLKQIYEKLGCQEKTAGGVCWFECNTSADKAVILFHGVTGGKIDMVPLAERYVNFGYAVYAIDLPGHGGSVQPPLNTYDDLADWLVEDLAQLGRTPDLIVSNSYSSSIVYHALRTEKIPKNTKVIMACPTPDQSRLADTLQVLSSYLPEKITWEVYNCMLGQKIRMACVLKTKRQHAWQWLGESEKYKKSTTTLKKSNALTTLLYQKNPYIEGVPSDYDVTIIIGGEDNIITPKTQGIMKDLLPTAKFIIDPAAGHILQFEAVDSYPDV